MHLKQDLTALTKVGKKVLFQSQGQVLILQMKIDTKIKE